MTAQRGFARPAPGHTACAIGIRPQPEPFVPARVLSPGEELHRPAFTYFRGPVERLRRGDVHVLRRAGAGGAFLDDRVDAGDIVVVDVKPIAYTQ